jgi:hypothetical protein
MNTDELTDSMRAAVMRLRAVFPRDGVVSVHGSAISCSGSLHLEFTATVDNGYLRGKGRTPTAAVEDVIAQADPQKLASVKLAEAARLTEEARILNEGAAKQRQAQAQN